MKFICSLSIILFSLQSIAQHTVSGIVSDKIDKSVLIEGVSVFIPELNRMEYSKEGGTYIIRNIGEGAITLVFSKRGYYPVVKHVTTFDSATVVHAELTATAGPDKEVVFSGQMIRTEPEVSYPVTVKHERELRRHAHVRMMDALSYEPGIDMITYGNGVSIPSIRGSSGSKVVLRQQGFRLALPAFDMLYPLPLIDHGTRAVEVIKGPAGLRYGPDAVGGVVIFHDELPAPEGVISGDINTVYHTNTAGVHLLGGVKGTTTDGIFYSAGGGMKSHTSYIEGPEGSFKKNTEEKDYTLNSKWRESAFKATVGKMWRKGSSAVSFAMFDQLTDEIQLRTPVSLLDDSVEQYQRSRDFNAPYTDFRYSLVGLKNTFFTGRSKLMLNASYQSTEVENLELDSGISEPLRYFVRQKSFTWEAIFQSDPLRRFGYEVGLQGMMSEGDLVPGLLSQRESMDMGGFINLRYELPALSFEVGGRLDLREEDFLSEAFRKERSNTLATFAAGAVWRPVSRVSIRVNGSTGFYTPDAYQTMNYKFTQIIQDSVTVIETLDAGVEESMQGDAGISFDGVYLTTSIRGFIQTISNYTYEADVLNLVTPTDTFSFLRYDQADATISGIEFYAEIHHPQAKWVKAFASFSLMRREIESVYREPAFPADKLVTGITFRAGSLNYLHDPFIQVVYRNFSSPYVTSIYAEPVDDYGLLDARLGGSFKWGRQTFDLTIAVTNVLGTNYTSHLSSLRGSGIPNMGRNVSIAIRLPFHIRNPKVTG